MKYLLIALVLMGAGCATQQNLKVDGAKYEIGAKVWRLEKNEAVEKEIKGIILDTKGRFNYFIEFATCEMICVFTTYFEVYPETELFTTKQDLLNSL